MQSDHSPLHTNAGVLYECVGRLRQTLLILVLLLSENVASGFGMIIVQFRFTPLMGIFFIFTIAVASVAVVLSCSTGERTLPHDRFSVPSPHFVFSCRLFLPISRVVLGPRDRTCCLRPNGRFEWWQASITSSVECEIQQTNVLLFLRRAIFQFLFPAWLSGTPAIPMVTAATDTDAPESVARDVRDPSSKQRHIFY